MVDRYSWKYQKQKLKKCLKELCRKEGENMKKIPLIILTGPTAVGKTNLSIQLAKNMNM